MITKKIGAGTTLNLTLNLDRPISDYENIFVSVYTDKMRPINFSYVEKENFNTLEIGASETQIVGILKSEQTKTMCGILYIEIKAILESGKNENIGDSIPTIVKDNSGRALEFVNATLSKIS